MATIIEMPKLSDTMTTGTLVNWLKKEGEAVQPGDMLAEVETDKATMEVENFDEGVLLKQYVKAGSEVPIGAPMCAIGEAGEAAPDVEVSQPASKPVSGKNEGAPLLSSETAGTVTDEKAPVSDAADAPAAAPTPEKATEPAPVTASATGGRIKASPLARKIAAEKGIDLATIAGSGPHGRIVRKDVLAAPEQSIAPKASRESTPQVAVAPVGFSMAVAEDSTTPLTNMRKIIAQRLVESKTTVPHFYLKTEVDAAPLIELRAAVNGKLADLPPEKGGFKFTINDFIHKAVIEAIRQVPEINQAWIGDGIRQYGAVHLSFGVAIGDGLVTPVIRNAESKTLRQLGMESKSLINKARNKKLIPDEMTGSTITVSNLGMFGITEFYAIVNPPNAAMLSVGATIQQPVVDKSGNIVPGYRMSIGFSGDHRVIDGATGARFLAALKEILETPASMLV